MNGYVISLFIIILMSTAKILCWNCRGISARDTYSRVFRLIRTLKQLLVCLVETRAKSERVDRFCNKIPRRLQWVVILSDGFSGGIIVIWNPIIGKVTANVSSCRALYLAATSQSSSSFIIYVIYNSLQCRS